MDVMRKSTVFSAGAVVFFTAFFLALGLGARAQVGFLPHVRVKAGVFMPSGGALKSSSSDTWYKVGADVNIPIPLVGSTRIGIDYEASGSSRMVPITVTQIFQPNA